MDERTSMLLEALKPSISNPLLGQKHDNVEDHRKRVGAGVAVGLDTAATMSVVHRTPRD